MDDAWISSACSLCYNQCGIKVHKKDGVVVKIEGNPESPLGMGRLCPKGLAGIMLLYDPHRVNVPLKRTNPEKGIHVDPKWVEITWDEALATITEKLKKIREEDPRKLVLAGCVPSLSPLVFGMGIFMPAFGSSNVFVSNGHQCGNAEHLLAATLHGALTTNPDLQFTNYLLVFGSHCGTAAYYALTTMAQRMADARARGMKLVVVDPMLNASAEKADEWIPIRPGTDGALALALLNVLLNELRIYDAEYLRAHTNAPYLIGPEGFYVRDKASGKPLVWDSGEGKATAFDDATVKAYALEGTYEANGWPCRPAFELLRDHVRRYTPEMAEGITGVPAATIRRIAREFGEAARVGSTITIDGKTLPYRPASVVYFKGAHGHNHAWLTSLAIELLCEVVGASNVPGGLLGCNPVCYGHPDTGLPRWIPKADRDGLLLPGLWFGASEPGFSGMLYPPPEPRSPQWLHLQDLFPTSLTSHLPILTIQDPARFGIPYTPEVLINYGSNLLMSVGNPETTAEALKRLYVISFNLFLDETTAFADLVLPDACYLERLDPSPNNHIHHFPVGLGEWGWQIRQPVVPPLGERRHFAEVLLEVAERIGMAGDLYAVMNHYYGLKPPYRLDRDRHYTWEALADRIYKTYFGSERGLEWFKAHGVLKWPKRVEEAYWKPFIKARVPIYFEWMKALGERVAKITQALALHELDTSDFQPLPDWKPCVALATRRPGFDLQAIYYRVAWHTFSMTYENPWLDEISNMAEPYSYFISINAATARAKGIRDGDWIWVESAEAGRVKGRARLVEGIHPEVVGIANNGGHWAPGMPVARGKGVFFEALMPLNLKALDPVSLTIDCDARVRVYKA
jgi:molybdopterin-containing oxidoreductase family molybdopterin binding subunit